ncbi:S-layer homology domain-containing protein, partial [Paenibacillus sp.]|uniref:S-layer homology domain-containing protein n=1 Tax=Paenibacillus sp. TaxID=58172 RepID=UPI002811E0E0
TASNVTVSGTAQVGSQLTGAYDYADANGDEESGTTYRWLRYDAATGGTGEAIEGATNPTYTLTQADVGKYIAFEVTPKNAATPTTGAAVESANRSGPVASAGAAPTASNVTVSGTAQVGSQLTGAYDYADANGDEESGTTYRWLRYDAATGGTGEAIEGATNPTYTLTQADVGKYIAFEVTPKNAATPTTGAAVESANRSGPVASAGAAPTASNVTVSGTAQVGSQLTGAYDYADANGDEESGTTYRWLRYDAATGGTGEAIEGATSPTYTLTQADVGKYIAFEVTPKNAATPTTGAAVESGNRSGPVTVPTTPPVTAVGSVDGAGTVTVSAASPNAALALYDKFGVPVATGTADAEGRFTFTGVAFGADYAATQSVNGVESALSNKVAVGPGAVVAVGSVGGEGTVTVTGAVYDTVVTLYDKLGNVVGSGIADGTGSYTFQGVLPGTDYAATQTVDGIESAVSNKVSVGTGLVTITGSRNGAGTITVTGAVYGATLTLYDKNGGVTSTGIANPDGTYTFVGVPVATDYTVTQTVDGLESGRSSKVDVGPGIVAAVGSSNGEGTVTATGGNPNATLKLYDKDGRLVATGIADGNGAFVFAGVPTGTDYSVTQTVGGLESEPSAKVRVGDDVADALKQVKVRFSQGDIWESVTLPVFLIADGAYETVVGWKSSKPAVINIEPEAQMQGGEVPEYKTRVNRQAEDVNVILTAIVEKDGRKLERTFLLIVKSNQLEEEKVTTPATNAVKVGDTVVDQGVRVTRTTLSTDGAPVQTVDKLVMSDTAMQAIVNSVTGNIRIDFDDKPNASSDARADEIAVEIANAALQVIERNGGARALNVTTPEGAIQLQPNSISQLTEAGIDLFFRIVPIRDAGEKQVVVNRTAQTMQAEAGSGKTAEVLGIPREIVTNYVGYETEVIFPLTGLGITSEQIDSIRLLIEHDDETRIVKVGDGPLDGTIVTDEGNVPVGFKFKLQKFSTFTFFRVSDAPTATAPVDSVESVDVPKQEVSITPPKGNEVVTDREVTIVGKATPNVQVDVYLNGRKVGTAKSDAQGTWTFLAGELAEGEYEVQAAIAGSGGAKSQAFKFVVAKPFVHYKYINGYPDGEFKPENSITRAEMAMMLARILQRSEEFTASPGIGAASYPDVPTSHWAFGAIERMKETGIMKGYENGEFHPDKRITRAEMAATMLRFLDLEPLTGTTTVYTDLEGHWAIDHVETLRQKGIMNGYPEGNFYPNRDLTRAEAVTMINRAVGRGPLTGNYASLWPDVSKTYWAYADVGEASKSHEAIWTQDGKEQWIRFVEGE